MVLVLRTNTTKELLQEFYTELIQKCSDKSQTISWKIAEKTFFKNSHKNF